MAESNVLRMGLEGILTWLNKGIKARSPLYNT